jgi:hypothetical protein
MNGSGFLVVLLIVIGIVIWSIFLSPKAQEKRAEQVKFEAEEREKRLKLEAEVRESQLKLESEEREKRLKIKAERRAKREAKEKRLKEERDDYIKSVRKNHPNFILQARIEFERAYKSSGGSTSFFGQEKSPLACFGYVVGKTKGRKPAERKQIIEYTLCAEIPDFFPTSYSSEWGTPLSATRFNKIHSHITSMADLRSNRPNFEFAVSDWRADAAWMQRDLTDRVSSYW